MTKLFLISMILMIQAPLAQAACVKVENGKEVPLSGTERGYTIDKRSLGALQREFRGLADQAFTGDTDTCSDDAACKNAKKYITCK